MQKNRLAEHWNIIKPKTLNKWSKLHPQDLEAVNGDFDKLVEVVRQHYYPGRSKLSIEGSIRDWLYAELDELDFNQN